MAKRNYEVIESTTRFTETKKLKLGIVETMAQYGTVDIRFTSGKFAGQTRTWCIERLANGRTAIFPPELLA